MTAPDTNYTRDDDPLDDPLLHPERGFYRHTAHVRPHRHCHALMPSYRLAVASCTSALLSVDDAPKNPTHLLMGSARYNLGPAPPAVSTFVFRLRHDAEEPNDPRKC